MFFLKFDTETENKYIEDIYEHDLIRLRLTLVLCILFYIGYFALDSILFRHGELTRDQWNYFFKIRFLFVVPAFVINYVWTYHKSFKRVFHYVTSVAYMVAGVGIAMMLVEVPTNFGYYGGMFLIFAVGHFLSMLSLEALSVSSVMIIFIYNVLTWRVGGDLPESLTLSSFYLGFVIICIYAGFISERYRRENFIQKDQLRGDKVVLERDLYEKLLDIENSNRITIFSLARLAESKDRYTGDHIERIGSLCLKLAESLPQLYYIESHEDKEQICKSIELASTLHDIGKVAIPEHILMKPAKLTEDEMTVMKTHTIIGSDTLNQIREAYTKNDFVNMGVEICMYHHERWDGKGYPEGLKGHEIPLSARIVSIVDVYDALISERPYKLAMTKNEALKIMSEGSGTQFDPNLLYTFLDIMETEN